MGYNFKLGGTLHSHSENQFCDGQRSLHKKFIMGIFIMGKGGSVHDFGKSFSFAGKYVVNRKKTLV